MANQNFVPTRVLEDERFAGKRADYHVYYYNHKGKGTVDAAYGETEEAARAEFARCALNLNKNALGGSFRILRMVKTEGGL